MPNEPHEPRAQQPAEPPGGGRQNHEAMRQASMRPVTGPASTDTLAASGGLDVPGREPESTEALSTSAGTAEPRERIPGERDPSSATHRQPGAVSGQFSGGDLPAGGPSTLDDRTRRERQREGGGGKK